VKEIWIFEDIFAFLLSKFSNPEGIITAGVVNPPKELIGELLELPDMLPILLLQVKAGQQILANLNGDLYTIEDDMYLDKWSEQEFTFTYLSHQRLSVYERFLYYECTPASVPPAFYTERTYPTTETDVSLFFPSSYPTRYTSLLLWSRVRNTLTGDITLSFDKESLPFHDGYLGQEPTNLEGFSLNEFSYIKECPLGVGAVGSTYLPASADALGIGRNNLDYYNYFSVGYEVYMVYADRVPYWSFTGYVQGSDDVEIKTPATVSPGVRDILFNTGLFLAAILKIRTTNPEYDHYIIDGSWFVGEEGRKVY
jgi:hypothetical protein